MLNKSVNKYNKLAKNTIIFFLGSFGSKLISFLIVPLYTYVLTTAEYGTVDIFTTTINLLYPFLILGLNEAVLRFMVGKEMDKKSVASNCFIVLICSWTLIWVLYYANRNVSVFGGYSLQFVTLLTLTAFNQIYIQYLRGIEKNKQYALNGIIVTITTVFSNCIFLLYLKLNIQGYILSLILAQIVSSMHIIISARLWNEIKIRYINLKDLKVMLVYCIPLIPNSLMWWLMNASDKYMIQYMVGIEGNGIYSVAHKIPAVLQLVYSVFMQAWQISAIEENNSKGRRNFYNIVYIHMIAVLCILSSLIIILAKPLYTMVLSTEYKVAWKYVPILVISGIFSSLSSFLGTIYVANKESKIVFRTTFIGAILNIIFNYVFIRIFGLQGAAVGTFLGYMGVVLIRATDTRKYFKIDYKLNRLFPATIILFLQLVLLLCIDGIWVYGLEIVCFMLIFIIYRNEFATLINKGLKKFSLS